MRELIIQHGVEINALLALLFVVILSSDLTHKRLFLFAVGAVICLVLTLQAAHCLLF